MRRALSAVQQQLLDSLPGPSLVRIMRGALHLLQHAPVARLLEADGAICPACGACHSHDMFYLDQQEILHNTLLREEIECMLQHGKLLPSH